MWSKKSEKIFSDIKKYGPKNNDSNRYYRRQYFTQNYSWAVPNKTAIKKIKKFSNGKILEIGSGLGLWAFLLKDVGADIIPTDKSPSKKTFTKVEKLSVEKALDKYDADVLLLVWPPFDDPMANNALKKFKGNKVIYIGEGYEGATGDDNFHRRLEKDWDQVDQYDIPRWPYMYDTMTFYSKINN
jgi:hypothetical protein